MFDIQSTERHPLHIAIHYQFVESFNLCLWFFFTIRCRIQWQNPSRVFWMAFPGCWDVLESNSMVVSCITLVAARWIKTTDLTAVSFRHQGTLRHFLNNVYHMCTQGLRIGTLPHYCNVLDEQQGRGVVNYYSSGKPDRDSALIGVIARQNIEQTSGRFTVSPQTGWPLSTMEQQGTAC